MPRRRDAADAPRALRVERGGWRRPRPRRPAGAVVVAAGRRHPPGGVPDPHRRRLRLRLGRVGRAVLSCRCRLRPVPPLDRRRGCRSRTDLGESDWSEPVGRGQRAAVRGRLVGRAGSASTSRSAPPKGERPAYWLRSVVRRRPAAGARLHVTALGLVEVFVNGARVGDVELAPGLHAVPRAGAVRSPTTSPRCCGRAATSSPSCWPTAGTAGRSGCPGPQTSSARTRRVRLQIETPARRRPAGRLAGTDRSWRTSPSHVTGGRPDRRAARGPPARRPRGARPGVRRQRLAGRAVRARGRRRRRSAGRPARAPGRGDPPGLGDARVGDDAVVVDLGPEHQRLGAAVRPRSGRHPHHAAPRRTPRRRRRSDDRPTSTSTCRSSPSRCRSGQVDEVDLGRARPATSSSRGSPPTASATPASRATPAARRRRRDGRGRAHRPAPHRLVRAAATSGSTGCTRRSSGRCAATSARSRPTARSASAPAGPVTGRSSRRPRPTSTTCSASPARGCATSRSTSGPTAAWPNMSPCPPAEGFDGPVGLPQRLGRLGRRRGQRPLGPLPGLRRRLAAARDLGVGERLGRLRRAGRPRQRTPSGSGGRATRSRRRTRSTCGTADSTGASGSSPASRSPTSAPSSVPTSPRWRRPTCTARRATLARIGELIGARRGDGRRAYQRDRRAAPARPGRPSSSGRTARSRVRTQAAHVRALAFDLVPRRAAATRSPTRLVDARRRGRRAPDDRLPVDRPAAADAGRRRPHRHGVPAAAAGHRAVVADDDRPRRHDDVGALERRRRRRGRRTSRSTTTARARSSPSCTATSRGCSRPRPATGPSGCGRGPAAG